MKKIFSLFMMLLLTMVAQTAFAQLVPELTTDANNPKLYTIASYSRGGYLASNGAGSGVTHVDLCGGSYWYFTASPDNTTGTVAGGVIAHNVDGTSLTTAWKTDTTGGVVFILPNGVNENGLSISKTNPISNSSCADANNYNTGVGNWNPSSNDWVGTTWVFAEATLSDIKNSALSSLNSYYLASSSLISTYTSKINAATTANGVNAELANALAAYQSEVGGKIWHIKSGYAGYYTQQSVYKCMLYNTTSGNITWGTLDENNPNCYLKIEVVAGGKICIKNMAGKYMQGVAGALGDAAGANSAATLTKYDDGTFNIVFGNGTAHTNGHQSGAGVSGNLVSYPGGAGSGSSWKFEETTQTAYDHALAISALDARIAAVSSFRSLANSVNSTTTNTVLGTTKTYDSAAAVAAYDNALSAYNASKSETTCAAVESAVAAQTTVLNDYLSQLTTELSTKYFTLQNQRVPAYMGVKADDTKKSWCGDESVEYDNVWQFVPKDNGFNIYNVKTGTYLATVAGGSTSTTSLVEKADAGTYSFEVPTTDTEKDGKTLYQINCGSHPLQAETAGYLNWWNNDGGTFNARWSIEAVSAEELENLTGTPDWTALEVALAGKAAYADYIGTGLNKYTYMSNGVASTKEAYAKVISDAQAVLNAKESSTLTKAQVAEYTTSVLDAYAGLVMNKPVVGEYYLIHNITSETVPYLSSSATTNYVCTSGDANRSVFRLVEGNKLLNVAKNLYISSTLTGEHPVYTANIDEAVSFDFIKSESHTAKYNIVFGADQYLYDWTTYDPTKVRVTSDRAHARNQWTIEEVEAVEFNYVYKVGNATKIVPVSGFVGLPLPALQNIPAFLSAETPEGTITANQQNVVINFNTDNFPFEFAPSVDKVTKWYTMDMHGNEAKYVVYANNEKPIVDYTPNTNSSAYDEEENLKSEYYAWAFIGNPFDGFKIYNRAAGKYMYQPKDANVEVVFSEEGNLFTVYEQTQNQTENSFCMKVADRNYYLNHQGTSVKGWTDADGGSGIRVYEISNINAMVTYVYMHGDTEWYREHHSVKAGSNYPDLHEQPSGVKFLTIPTGIVSTDCEFVVECEYEGSGTITHFSDSYENAQWVYLTLHDNNYHLQYVSGQNVKVNTSQTTRPANFNANYAYQWAFVGNPISGFSIMNRAAGSGYILSSPAVNTASNTGGSTFPVMTDINAIPAGNNKYWTAYNYGAGFTLAREGETVKLNNRDGVLSYWTGTDAGSRFAAELVNHSVTAKTDVDTQLTYNIINRSTGSALSYNGTSMTTAALDGSDAQAWTVSFNSTTNVMTLTNKTHGNVATVYLNATDNGYYNILNSLSVASGQNERIALADAGNNSVVNYTTWMQNAEWKFVKAAEPTTEQITATSQLVSGKYYRFINVNSGSALNENTNSKLNGATISDNSASQVWKLTTSSTKWVLQNMDSDKYIASSTNSSISNPYPTGTAAATFTIGAATEGFYISERNNGNGLNHNSSYNTVQDYTYASDRGSMWYIYEVKNADEIKEKSDAIKNELAAASAVTNSQLQTYFADNACTELKSQYAAMTDAELRTAMASMPTAVQEMAVKVKNNAWSDNATRSEYEKNFRIADYEIYTNCNWNRVVGVGPFAMLYNPTGITVQNGDVVYVFAQQGPKDSDAELLMHIVPNTDRGQSAQAVTLSQGVNVVRANMDGEIFIDYTLNNAPDGVWNNKTVNQYEPITVHIEGGNCEGMWDLHRGMTNNDWLWLKNNMFTNEYLHVKGNSTILNTITREVVGEKDPTTVMKIWDFVFDTQERLVDCGKYIDCGAYKPLINSRRAADGTNPNWDGGHGTNHPGLSYSDGNGVFSRNGLVYTGTDGGKMWVIEHEEGHAHQYPVNVAGATESSNNALAQIVNHLWGYRSSRGKGVYDALKLFNEGYTWVDYMRAMNHRRVSLYDTSIWMTNHMFFQLWLYFDYLGNYQPEGGKNDGFAFFSRLSTLVRQKGGIRYGHSKDAPGNYKTDYMLFAECAAEAAETDLSEFFQMWGIFRYADEVKITSIPSNSDASVDENTNDDPTNGIYFIGDYGNYYMKMPMRSNAEDVAYVNGVIDKMKSYEKKAPNLLFINDVAKDIAIRDDAEVLKYDPSLAGQTVKYYLDNGFGGTQGDFGMFTDFGNDEITSQSTCTISGTTVTVTGDALVGLKIYDNSGNLIYVSNEREFTVSSAVATALNNGTYTLIGVSGDGYELNMLDPDYEVRSIGDITRFIRRMMNGDTQITVTKVGKMANRVLQKK